MVGSRMPPLQALYVERKYSSPAWRRPGPCSQPRQCVAASGEYAPTMHPARSSTSALPPSRRLAGWQRDYRSKSKDPLLLSYMTAAAKGPLVDPKDAHTCLIQEYKCAPVQP